MMTNAASPQTPDTRPSIAEIAGEAAKWRRDNGVDEPTAEEAMVLALEAQQEVRTERETSGH